jgi:hypothetical protein
MISVSQNMPLTVNPKAKRNTPETTTQNSLVDTKLLVAAECGGLIELEFPVALGQSWERQDVELTSAEVEEKLDDFNVDVDG